MTRKQEGRWPNYTYIVPEIYTKAKVRLIGFGNYAPSSIITNEFFASISTRLGDPRSAEDLERVTGLKTRRVRASTLVLCRKIAGLDAPGLIDGPDAPEDESVVDMAVIAAQRSLASAGRTASEVDTVIGASSSDNDVIPTLATQVQRRLGLRSVRTTMLKGACALQTESFQISAEVLAVGSAKLVLLVTAEGLLPNITNILDWKTSSLMGEGAAAFLVERGDEETYVINGYDANQGPALYNRMPLRKDVIAMAEVEMNMRQLFQEGKSAEVNTILSQYLDGYMKMNGKEVFREAPRAMAESIDVLCRHAKLSPDELVHIVPHQANSRIIRRLGELLIHDYGWPPSTMQKLVDNFRDYGNLSNASIGTALVELLRQGSLHEGEWMALPAAGGGMHYGCWLLRFHALKNPDAVLNPA